MWTIRVIMFVRGLALAFVFVPIQAAAYANIEPADTGRASAIFSALRQIAASLGVAILATVLVEATTHFSEGASTDAEVSNASLDAFHFSFFVGSMLVLAAGAAAMMIKDSDAAKSMRGYVAPRTTPGRDHRHRVKWVRPQRRCGRYVGGATGSSGSAHDP